MDVRCLSTSDGGITAGIDSDGKHGSDSFTPVAVGTILMFGRDEFGQTWMDENARRFV